MKIKRHPSHISKRPSRSQPDIPSPHLNVSINDGNSGVGEDTRRERGYAHSPCEQQESSPSGSSPHLTTVAPSTRPTGASGHYVTVVDLAPLLRGHPAPCRYGWTSSTRHVTTRWRIAHVQAVAVPGVLCAGRGAGVDALDGGRRAAHVYDIFRGRTYAVVSAVVEGLNWADDGRWLAVGTKNRTVHVFGVNLYGGKPDVRSHVEGRVRNVEVIVHISLGVSEVTRREDRLRTNQSFLSSDDVASTPNLAFPFAPPPITYSPTFSPSKLTRGTNYQDILVFDPVDGYLTLCCVTINKQPVKEQGLGASMHVLGVTSISLPGMGSAGRLSLSPVARMLEAASAAAGGRAGEQAMELAVREGLEAAWDLKRAQDVGEIKTPVMPGRREGPRGIPVADWLAEGEITTCSNSTCVLPRSLYLSH
ncbi:hypothetical protein HYPSUDRAFT_1072976 [Hypholoma sublateritium FD-334 SS-4]|uniref:BCAS3 WD40 domain-containing protein n=1 Tax=Hypholoma sublateritium (strain FD-334 SS-4) TaxID=945553 RepID=A0A0D2N5A4_HYPSF|nr:hypothetical protein HYPSUDRAFT_1072976 [Hypholoma sublateritium FD-334 SS-4]